MLLDEDLAILIRDTTGNFNIQPDKLAVARVNESLSTLQQARELRLRDAQTALKKLSRTFTTLSSHHAETVASHSSKAHASEIASLDTQKFRIAKSASDLEMETERLSSQLADLQSRLQELELQGVDGGVARSSIAENEILLRLWVFRSLGIEAERDPESGEYVRAVVRNGRKGDTNVISLDNKFSKFFYANYFWQTL